MKQMVLELPDEAKGNLVLDALEGYKARLRLSIKAGKQKLAEFENRYGISTEYFFQETAAEDLAGNDLEYVEWAGEAKLLDRLITELDVLEGIRCELP